MQAESNLLLILINSTSDYYYAYNPPIPSHSFTTGAGTNEFSDRDGESVKKRVGDAIEGPTSKRVSTTIIGTGEQGYAIVHVSYT